jgi:hypothetical protein
METGANAFPHTVLVMDRDILEARGETFEFNSHVAYWWQLEQDTSWIKSEDDVGAFTVTGEDGKQRTGTAEELRAEIERGVASMAKSMFDPKDANALFVVGPITLEGALVEVLAHEAVPERPLQ